MINYDEFLKLSKKAKEVSADDLRAEIDELFKILCFKKCPELKNYIKRDSYREIILNAINSKLEPFYYPKEKKIDIPNDFIIPQNEKLETIITNLNIKTMFIITSSVDEKIIRLYHYESGKQIHQKIIKLEKNFFKIFPELTEKTLNLIISFKPEFHLNLKEESEIGLPPSIRYIYYL